MCPWTATFKLADVSPYLTTPSQTPKDTGKAFRISEIQLWPFFNLQNKSAHFRCAGSVQVLLPL